MRKALTVFLLFMFVMLANSQDSLEFKPYEKGVDPEYLTGLKSRFEIVLAAGYTSINNLSGNAKTSNFKDHFNSLSSGVKVELGIGYNISEHFKASVLYGFRTANEQSLYVLNDVAETSEIPFYISDNYRFSEIGVRLDYRIPIVKERLQLVPHVGAGGIKFQNNGEWGDGFIQESRGWIANAGLGFDYLASNVVALGVATNYGYANFGKTELDFTNQNPDIPFEVDDKFSFLDVLLKFYLFF